MVEEGRLAVNEEKRRAMMLMRESIF